MTDKTIIGPFTIDLHVHVEDKESGLIGDVTMGMRPGRVPTRKRIMRAAAEALAAIPGSTLIGPYDFFNRVLVKKRTGRNGKFAVPAFCEYDTEQLAAEVRAQSKDQPT